MADRSEYFKTYYKSHRERIKKRQAGYYLQHKDACQLTVAKWQSDNREAINLARRNSITIAEAKAIVLKRRKLIKISLDYQAKKGLSFSERTG